MKIGPLHPPSTFGLAPSTEASEKAHAQATEAAAKAGPIGGQAPIDPEKLRLAQEFEQIFIRKMLSSLEKSGHNAGGAASSASGEAYGSMVVSALAEAVSKGGGVGLAEMIARAASQAAARAPAPDATRGVPPPPTATYARPAPAVIFNQNHDMHNSLKDPKS